MPSSIPLDPKALNATAPATPSIVAVWKRHKLIDTRISKQAWDELDAAIRADERSKLPASPSREAVEAAVDALIIATQIYERAYASLSAYTFEQRDRFGAKACAARAALLALIPTEN